MSICGAAGGFSFKIMSVKVMAKIWENGPTSMPDRFVLLAIADHANDEGQAFPGVASLARKTCMTPRGVQKILRRLQTDGWLAIELRQGRFHCNLYTVLTPNTVHPQAEKEAQETLNGVHLHPEHGSLYPEPGSPKPSLTIKEPSVPPIVPQGGQEQGERANEPAQQAEPVKAKPKRERKPRGERKPRPDDALMDALAALGGCNPRETPRSRWSAIARCKWDLVEVCPDLTPAEIDRRATNYRTHFEGAALTPEALTKHWARCAEPKRGLTPMRPEPVLRFV